MILYSTTALFAACSDVPGTTFAFWRTSLAIAPVMVIAMVLDRQGTFRHRPGKATVLSGLFPALHHLRDDGYQARTGHLDRAPRGAHPVLTGLYGAWGGELFTASFVLAALLGISGTAFVATTDSAVRRTDPAGVLLSLAFALLRWLPLVGKQAQSVIHASSSTADAACRARREASTPPWTQISGGLLTIPGVGLVGL